MRSVPAATYRLHGLRFRSEFELPAHREDSADADYDVQWADAPDCDQPADDVSILASLSLPQGRGYVHVRTRFGYALRFLAIGEFRVHHDRRAIDVHLAPDVDRRIAPLLLAGSVPAFLLNLTGDCVLHASAVEVGGSALAFVGSQGSGKSTLAAAFCAAGAALITDDVLRVSSRRGSWRCFTGSLDLRLRPGAADLAGHFPDSIRRATVDNRIGVRPKACEVELVPLRAIFVPRIAGSREPLRIRRLSGPEALFSLSRCPGMPGWQVDEPMRRQFQMAGCLVSSVPVYEATIPWRASHSSDLVGGLLQSLR